jgi:hypothetical protein
MPAILDIASCDGPPHASAVCVPRGCRVRGLAIEVECAPPEQVVQRPADVRLELLSPLALEELLDAGPQLHDRDRGGHKLVSFLTIGPRPPAGSGAVVISSEMTFVSRMIT